ncbi:MAG: hypothetical protein R3D33_16085 [Hyphomicrobiaceae bacterium]
MSLSPNALRIAKDLCPYPLCGVTDEALGDILDAWLADEFASESHRHIHDWFDEDRRNESTAQ